MTRQTKKSEGLSLADIARKIVMTSIGSASVARDLIADPSKSKDVLQGLLGFAEQRKEDVLNILAKEVSKFLTKIDVSSEMAKALKGLVIDLQASINFSDQDKPGLKPKIRVTKARTRKKTASHTY